MHSGKKYHRCLSFASDIMGLKDKEKKKVTRVFSYHGRCKIPQDLNITFLSFVCVRARARVFFWGVILSNFYSFLTDAIKLSIL